MFSLVLVVVFLHATDALLNGNVIESPQTTPECRHLITGPQQSNYYIEEHGQKCCMCKKGTRVLAPCKFNDINSTLCETCQHDGDKQTYIHYGPHNKKECIKDTVSCMPSMIKVGGSSSSPSRCICPSGTVLVDRHHCKTIPFIAPIYGTEATKLVQKILDTVSSTRSRHYNTTTMMSSTEPITNSTRQGIFVNLPAVIASLAVLVVLVILVGLVLYQFRHSPKLVCLKDLFSICETNYCVVSRVNEEAVVPVDSRLSVAPLLSKEPVDEDDAVIESYVVIEKIPEPTVAVAYVTNVQECGDDPLLTPSQVERAAQQELDGQDQEFILRDHVFTKWAEDITYDDLCVVGRTLLKKQKNAFDDIVYNDHPKASRREKATKIFERAVLINPALTLVEMKEVVKDLGYLLNVVEARIAELRTDGNVD